MDEKFSFWYPVLEETQVDFEGRPYIKEVFCTGHILYNGRLMCGESREVLKNRVKAKKEKTFSARKPTPKMCPHCLNEWRNCPDSPYYKFVHGAPEKVTSIERPLYEAQAQKETPASL